MFDAERLLGGLMQGAFPGALGGRGLGSTKSSRSVFGASGVQAGLGLLGVAMAAYEHYSTMNGPGAQSGGATRAAIRPPVPPPPPPRAAATQTMAAQEKAKLAIRAMIACAASDGQIDAEERGRIEARLSEFALSEEERAFISSSFEHPPSVQEIAHSVGSDRELAAQIYAASLVAVTLDNANEREYVKSLAAALALSREEISKWHTLLGVLPPLGAADCEKS